MQNPSEVYFGEIYRHAVHVVSLMDREAFSPTLGCMDRTYWAWKFTDFPGARFQEGLCALSFLLTTPPPTPSRRALPGTVSTNDFLEEPRLLDWISSGFDFWARIQRPGGDFDEAYPFERSLAAASFTSFYLSEARRMLGDRMPRETSDRFRQALARTGDWLCRNDETHGFLSNHLAAAAAALYHAYQICGEERFESRSLHFINKILDHQSDEGWYDEYGSADPGYQTHGSFYLARYWQLSGHPLLQDSLDRSFQFLAHFIHPDGSLGGEYASRNTQTYYPAAFEMMSGVSGSATWIAEHQLPAVASLAAAGLGTVDAYNLFPLMNNYVFAHAGCQDGSHRAAPAQPPEQSIGSTHFPDAGLLKIRRPAYDAFVGLDKGGVIKAFSRADGQLKYNDSGYIGRMKGGKTLSSQWSDPERDVQITENEVRVTGDFYQISKMVMKPLTFLGFRMFSLTVGRFRALGYWLKKLLVKVLIYRKRNLDLRFERRIVLEDDALVVEDHIKGPIGPSIETLRWVDVFTTIHMGSSRYFVPNDLVQSRFSGATGTDDAAAADEVDVTQLAEGVRVRRAVRFDNQV